MPLLFACLLICVPYIAGAATLASWTADPIPIGPAGQPDVFFAMVDAWAARYRDVSGPGEPDIRIMSARMGMFAALSLWLAAALPGQRRRKSLARYAELAALAMSRIRCTIARRPLERCDER